jgi:hypothetical protein
LRRSGNAPGFSLAFPLAFNDLHLRIAPDHQKRISRQFLYKVPTIGDWIS